ncbi:DUF6314 family protein [Octadecabacter sp. CECT 8868]|uniref:DUF6314 family protein n=1 Tax=Octadecabacter algicola TaxID=2909342 RepID=UPI001F34FD6D|nr:DUF6314 family protein [Octadecabacter algicola]MCF2903507.1 DUF6314 family protein [Octadecabacter algicola]
MRTISDFLGVYKVTREIADHRAEARSQFDGQAVIAATAEGATYRETGGLIVNGQRFEAERSYLWQQAGDRIWVSFEDGRAFHDFDPQSGGLASEHLCGEDMYRGGYEVSDWPLWSVTWNVKGPRKDYRSVTIYEMCSR